MEKLKKKMEKEIKEELKYELTKPQINKEALEK